MENIDYELTEVPDSQSTGSDTTSNTSHTTVGGKTHPAEGMNAPVQANAPEEGVADRTVDANVAKKKTAKLFLATPSPKEATEWNDGNWMHLEVLLECIYSLIDKAMNDVERYNDDPEFHERLNQLLVRLSSRPLTVLKLKPGEKVCLGDLIELTAPDKGQRARVNLTNHRFDPAKIMS